MILKVKKPTIYDVILHKALYSNCVGLEPPYQERYYKRKILTKNQTKMTNQVKIKQVESYEDSQGTHIVCKGKLVCGNVESFGKMMDIEELRGKLRPIIISETEEIEVGDEIYDTKSLHQDAPLKGKVDWIDDNHLTVLGSTIKYLKSYFRKIIVLPEQFTKAQLQAIVDGKIKDGDEVYVACDNHENNIWGDTNDYSVTLFLPEPGHVKLFPVKCSCGGNPHKLGCEVVKKEERLYTKQEMISLVEQYHNEPLIGDLDFQEWLEVKDN